jgi:hypothetical protein
VIAGIRHQHIHQLRGRKRNPSVDFCGMALVLVFGCGRLDVINEEHVDDSFLPLEF